MHEVYSLRQQEFNNKNRMAKHITYTNPFPGIFYLLFRHCSICKTHIMRFNFKRTLVFVCYSKRMPLNHHRLNYKIRHRNWCVHACMCLLTLCNVLVANKSKYLKVQRKHVIFLNGKNSVWKTWKESHKYARIYKEKIYTWKNLVNVFRANVHGGMNVRGLKMLKWKCKNKMKTLCIKKCWAFARTPSLFFTLSHLPREILTCKRSGNDGYPAMPTTNEWA